ncbi:hypothetical protein SAY87_030038 [Trapa incisa]|uniref:Uncharacterized protein n=1 Tax=Trapa incisa TaxID=236973 RepID=A0AAN7QA88_9MYRT|nr:hypothetical protein SAY87_030038 [Trapa incisa]
MAMQPGCIEEDVNYYGLTPLPIDEAAGRALAAETWGMLDSHGLRAPPEQAPVMEPDHHGVVDPL